LNAFGHDVYARNIRIGRRPNAETRDDVVASWRRDRARCVTCLHGDAAGDRAGGGAGTGWLESARPIRNVAFEAYRSSELKRLEDEERDFHAYLERLRGARDKTEFETYQRERMSTSTSAEGAPQP
jgi:hypothetical protein